MVLALCQRQPKVMAVYRFAGGRTHGFRVVIQHYAFQQFFHLAVVQLVFSGDFIDFGNVVPR